MYCYYIHNYGQFKGLEALKQGGGFELEVGGVEAIGCSWFSSLRPGFGLMTERCLQTEYKKRMEKKEKKAERQKFKARRPAFSDQA